MIKNGLGNVKTLDQKVFASFTFTRQKTIGNCSMSNIPVTPSRLAAI